MSLSSQHTLQRATGNCELRSTVLCSHGIKDGRVLRKMAPVNLMLKEGSPSEQKTSEEDEEGNSP